MLLNKIIPILAVLFLPFAFALDDSDYEIEPKENPPVQERTYSKKTGYIRPKYEHYKTKSQAEKELKKDKLEFQKLKNKQLKLLDSEYDILQYSR